MPPFTISPSPPQGKAESPATEEEGPLLDNASVKKARSDLNLQESNQWGRRSDIASSIDPDNPIISIPRPSSPRSATDACRLSGRAMCMFVQWARTEIFFFTVLFISGWILGLVLPTSAKLSGPYATVSNILGYIYFLAWSVSFYPQLLQNYRRKTTMGLSLDFQLLNLVGFLCYTAFAFSFYEVDSVQAAYEARHNGNQNKVSIQDLLFAVHAVVITLLTIGQMFYYDGRAQKLSRPVTLLLGSFLGAIAVYGILVATLGEGGNNGAFQVIDFLYFVSYIKLAISTIKGFPQAYLNYSLQSTEGWSIHNVLLDMTGGSLSLLQLLLDCQNTNDWSGIEGDPLKFGLSLVSMVFDVVFIVQHFFLYPTDGDEGLLREEEEDVDVENGRQQRRRGRSNSSNSRPLSQVSADWSPTYMSTALLEGQPSDSPSQSTAASIITATKKKIRGAGKKKERKENVIEETV